MAQQPRVALIGGGTGGHIYPLLAVTQKLRGLMDGVRVRYFGDAGKYYSFILANNEIELAPITSSKLRRYFSILNFLDFFRFFIGFGQALWKLYWYMPDVAFSKGGPGALAVIMACRWYQIPLVIHESDVIPGLTSKKSARAARKIFLAFEAARQYFADSKITAEITAVGQPVRDEILAPEQKDVAKQVFGLDRNKPVVLILGGSQGSDRINEFMLENLEDFTGKFQMIHEIGIEKYDEYKKEYQFISEHFSPMIKNNYQFLAYLDGQQRNMRDALNAADLVVSRAGAGAIFEIAAKGIPAVLVPLPESANGHQEANAYEYAKTGAAIVLEQENMLPHIFVNTIERLLGDQALQKKMSEAALKFYKPQSAETIARSLAQFLV